MPTSERVPAQPGRVSMAELLAAGVLARIVSEPPSAPPVPAGASEPMPSSAGAADFVVRGRAA